MSQNYSLVKTLGYCNMQPFFFAFSFADSILADSMKVLLVDARQVAYASCQSNIYLFALWPVVY